MTAALHPFVTRRGGRDLAGLEWGSGDDHLVLLHPNGFCAGLGSPAASPTSSGPGANYQPSTWVDGSLSPRHALMALVESAERNGRQ